ncbi:hypothetical protein KDA23_03710 [Candidatus Saccharibacteria bacterium]|nr:hypothetical protein [Candidatus Saccharibacteria bacterium]
MYEDIHQLDVLIPQFEAAFDQGKLNAKKISDFQHRLDQVAEANPYDENLGRESYKLYELQALIHQANGDHHRALEFLKYSYSLMDNRDNFLSRGARKWAQDENLLTEIVKISLRNSAIRSIWIGAVVIILSFVVMGIIYSISEGSARQSALESGQDNYSFHYLVLWGPVIYGGIEVYNGLGKLTKYKKQAEEFAKLRLGK